MLSPEMQAEIGRQVSQLIRYYERKAVPERILPDVEQECWRVALEALRNYDPARVDRPQGGYFYVACRRGVGPRIIRMLAAVSLSNRAAKDGSGYAFQTCVPLQQKSAGDGAAAEGEAGRERPDLVPAVDEIGWSRPLRPDEALARADALRRWHAARARLRRVAEERTRGLSEFDRQVGERLLGVDPEDEQDAQRELAQELGAPLRRVRGAWRRFSAAADGAAAWHWRREEAVAAVEARS